MFDDKPENATREEMLRWQKKKNTAKWRYKKLSSQNAEKYRESENARVKKTQEVLHQNIIDAASGQSNVYQHFADSPKTCSKEKSQNR